MIFIIVRDLIPNLTIYFFVSFIIHTVKSNDLKYKNFFHIKPYKTFGKKIQLGIIDGIIGTVIMMYGITVSTDILVDLRHFSIMISSLYGGLPSAIISAGIIAVSRVVFFEGISASSIFGAVNALNMAIGCGLIVRFTHSKRRWIYMNGYCLVSISIVAIFLLGRNWFIPMLALASISVISAICIFYLLNYLTKFNFLQSNIKENNAKFRAIAKNISDIVSILDQNGKTLYVSPSISAYGLQPKDYEGKYPRDYIHPEDIEKVSKVFFQCIQDKSIFKTDFRWLKPTGSYVYVEMRGTPIIEDTFVDSVVVVCRDISERKEIENKLLYLSNNDGLTGVANRRHFDQKLASEWEIARENSTFISLILFDIDYFKLYNDTYGHLAGDACLQNIAAYLKKLVQAPHLVARYGGEEFAIILINLTEEETNQFAEKIRLVVESLRIPHKTSKNSEYITVSLGCYSVIPSSLSSQKELIHKADQALYEAKKNGRNRVAAYPSDSTIS